MASKIEWVAGDDGKPGETWNPVTGCTPVSAGCANCYAKRMATRLRGRFGYPADEPFRVTIQHDKMEQPLRWRKPRRIFVCSMSDLFHEDVPDWVVGYVLYIARKAPHHTFMVLTKRAKRLAAMGRFLHKAPNIWWGVTAENQAAACSRVTQLMGTPAAVRFVSVEPMLGPVTLLGQRPDWVICGGETGPGARPMDLAWARDLRDQCHESSIPFFFKRVGQGRKTPADLMVRQWPTLEADV